MSEFVFEEEKTQPDSIYLSQSLLDDRKNFKYIDVNKDFKYINKNVLIKWAQEGLEITTKLSKDSSLFNGERIVFECLIDKLNEF